MHHLSALNSGDLDAAVAVYADSAIFITPDGETKGKTAIRKMLAEVLANVRGGGTGPRALFDVKRKYFTKAIGYIAWTQNAGSPEEVQGSDTFVVRRGKIVLQTAFLVPTHPPAP
jgi:ketosteroid isomerase-like protein